MCIAKRDKRWLMLAAIAVSDFEKITYTVMRSECVLHVQFQLLQRMKR